MSKFVKFSALVKEHENLSQSHCGRKKIYQKCYIAAILLPYQSVKCTHQFTEKVKNYIDKKGKVLWSMCAEADISGQMKRTVFFTQKIPALKVK